jgi:hypothetical protein
VKNPQGIQRGISSITLNGKAARFPIIMIDDGQDYHVDITMGAEIVKTEPLLEK